MPIFDLFKKKEKEQYTDVFVEPESDYDPAVYEKNYPRKYPMTSYAVLEDGVVFTRDVKDFLLRDLVKRIIFTDASLPEGYALFDLSLNQDRSVLAWNQTIDGQLCLVISTGEKGKGIEFNRACNFMFSGFSSLESIEWNNVISTKEVRSMRQMFAGCYKIKNLDLSCFDVSNTKYMDGLFSTCKKLENIKWFPFNTSKVETMPYMFTNCHSLRVIDLSGWDTSSLYSCKAMFNACGVKALNLGHFYPTSKERELNTEEMFATTGLLSVLTTDNPKVKEAYMNRDEATRECQEENDIPRRIVPVSEWKVPTYSFERSPQRGEALAR